MIGTTFPTLYKKTSTGAIQQWNISVEQAYIRTEFGQVDGKLQTTVDKVTAGKNVGKKNETTPEEQALLEAKAKWTKQKKKGYVDSIKAAEAEELDNIIEGGIVPMLAQKFAERGDRIEYPAYVQPKLDGARCIAIIDNGICTLWTRTRKPITGVPHIVRALEKAFMKGYQVLDGELYNHKYKNNFEILIGFIKSPTPKEGHEVVEYHVYDTVNTLPYNERHQGLVDYLPVEEECIKLVSTKLVYNEDGLMEEFEYFRSKGYEGAMVRNAAGLYVNKRSNDLQKIKEFDDAEFPIVGIEEGRGKLAGHAIFVCETKKGGRFTVKLKGETVKLKEYFDNHQLWEGKQLTVKYQGITNKKDVPRFPVGVAIRDYE